jgi:hypothetical protein
MQSIGKMPDILKRIYLFTNSADPPLLGFPQLCGGGRCLCLPDRAVRLAISPARYTGRRGERGLILKPISQSNGIGNDINLVWLAGAGPDRSC